MPTRKGSLGGRNDASSVAWATHGGSVAAWIAGPAALLRRFSLAAWRGLACASVALPDQIPVSIVGSACFHVSRVLYIVFFTGVARLSCTPAPRSTSVLGRSTFSASTSLPAINLRAFWRKKIGCKLSAVQTEALRLHRRLCNAD